MDANTTNIVDNIKDYYGKRVSSCQAEFKADVCQSWKMKIDPHVKAIMKEIHEDLKTRYWGCGLTAPSALENAHVLDLGCGSGFTCYVISKLVGANGHVTGLDMTKEQIDFAIKFVPFHTKLYGYSSPNVNFVMGDMEKIQEAGIKENTFDVIVSDCSICLSTDKMAVLKGAYTALKEGGEIYFSDIYADQRVPEKFHSQESLWEEGLAGALWWEDLHNLATSIGFSSPRIVSVSPYNILDEDLKKHTDGVNYISVTYRLFKLPPTRLSPCRVTYNGLIQYSPQGLILDHRTTFNKGEGTIISSETATILSSSRYNKFFTFQDLSLDDRVNPFHLI